MSWRSYLRFAGGRRSGRLWRLEVFSAAIGARAMEAGRVSCIRPCAGGAGETGKPFLDPPDCGG